MEKTINELKSDKEQLEIATQSIVAEFESKYPDIVVELLSVWHPTNDSGEGECYVKAKLKVFESE